MIWHGVVDAIVKDWDKLVPRVGRLLAVLAHARARRRPKFPIVNSFLPTLPSVTALHLQVPHLNLDLQPELAGGLFILVEVSSARIFFVGRSVALQLHPQRTSAIPRASTPS